MLFFFQAEDGIRDGHVTGVQTCALPISRWARLRSQTGIQSPTEYLKTRYNLPTQQLMAWSGVLLKLFDVGAKWAAIALLLNVLTGRSEEHTSELQSRGHLVCRLLLEKKKERRS